MLIHPPDPGRIAGLDEVGRGPLAGPVLAACVVLPRDFPAALADVLDAGLLDDSKRLTASRREHAYAALREAHLAGLIEIGVGAASVSEIARLNILQASLLAMRRAVRRLACLPDLALVDGNTDPGLGCPVRCVVGGDGIMLAIAAASIVAKVLRDRAMARLDVRHPGYGWAGNAGYGTRVHRAGLELLGPTAHHRAGFGTVRKILAERHNAAGINGLNHNLHKDD